MQAVIDFQPGEQSGKLCALRAGPVRGGIKSRLNLLLANEKGVMTTIKIPF